MSAPSVYLCLLHYPMTNRNGETVTTAVTNLDIHDISRSCRTYGLKGYFIVTPIEEQHALVHRILAHWQHPDAFKGHPDRAEALSHVKLCRDFQEVKEAIRAESGELPEVVLTDAREVAEEKTGKALKYDQYAQELRHPDRKKPAVVVFGTGWGIAPQFYPEVHRILEPIYGASWNEGYNHLSVRSAVAVILDRLLDRTRI